MYWIWTVTTLSEEWEFMIVNVKLQSLFLLLNYRIMENLQELTILFIYHHSHKLNNCWKITAWKIENVHYFLSCCLLPSMRYLHHNLRFFFFFCQNNRVIKNVYKCKKKFPKVLSFDYKIQIQKKVNFQMWSNYCEEQVCGSISHRLYSKRKYLISTFLLLHDQYFEHVCMRKYLYSVNLTPLF